MDSKSYRVLEHIYGLLGEGAFSILDVAELCPEGLPTAELDTMVSTLADEGYLVVKYADQGEYCLGSTPQGRALVAEVKAERERRSRPQAAVRPLEPTPIEAAADDVVAEESAVAPVDSAAEDETDGRPAVQAPSIEGKTVLLVWLAAFLGALLGGGIVGLVMYLLHVGLH